MRSSPTQNMTRDISFIVGMAWVLTYTLTHHRKLCPCAGNPRRLDGEGCGGADGGGGDKDEDAGDHCDYGVLWIVDSMDDATNE